MSFVDGMRGVARYSPPEAGGGGVSSSSGSIPVDTRSIETRARDLLERLRPRLPADRLDFAMGGILALLRTGTPEHQISMLVTGMTSASSTMAQTDRPLSTAAEMGAHQALEAPLEPGVGSHLHVLMLSRWSDRSSDPWSLFRDESLEVGSLLRSERFDEFDRFYARFNTQLKALDEQAPRQVQSLMDANSPLMQQLAKTICHVASVVQQAKNGHRNKAEIEQAGSDLRAIMSQLIEASAPPRN